MIQRPPIEELKKRAFTAECEVGNYMRVLPDEVTELCNYALKLEEQIKGNKDKEIPSSIPKGFHEIKNITGVYRKSEKIIVCGMLEPEEDGHNCDAMGCTPDNHILLKCDCNFLMVGYLL